jgi:hypothetical protein
MEELAMGGMLFGVLAIMGTVFMFGYNVGKVDGKSTGEWEMRNKAIVHCIEKQDLCKTEYNNIKTQDRLNNYKRPEIK